MLSVKNIFLPQKEISDFCRRWQIREFGLFGSVLRSDFGPDSDLGILIAFAPEAVMEGLPELDVSVEA